MLRLHKLACKALTREVESGNRSSVSNAGSTFPTDTSGEIDLLEQGELAHEFLCFRVRVLPAIPTAHPRRRVAWG